MDGSTLLVESVESDWSVDHAVEKYLEMAERCCDDEEDRYGPATLDALVTGSVNYTIRDVIDDGTGMTTLMLEAD